MRLQQLNPFAHFWGLRNAAYFCIILLVCGGCTAAAPKNASPSTATATPVPTHTVCASGCDFTTLQAAVDADNTQSGDIIGVLDAIHTEAGILIQKDIVIQGEGQDVTMVQAHADVEHAEDRVFRIAYGAEVTLRGMTVRHGHPVECPRYGGGIMNEGTLTLENVTVSDNLGSAGGGLANNGALVLINSAVSDNVADGQGGQNASGKGSGGGIKNMVGPMTLINSTVSGNTSAYNAGGIKVSCSGMLTLVDSTIRDNVASNNGGGLEVRGVITLTHSTITENHAEKSGGGLYIKGTSDHVRGIINFSDTIIQDNTPGDCVLGENATIGENRGNTVGDSSCGGAVTETSSN